MGKALKLSEPAASSERVNSLYGMSAFRVRFLPQSPRPSRICFPVRFPEVFGNGKVVIVQIPRWLDASA